MKKLSCVSIFLIIAVLLSGCGKNTISFDLEQVSVHRDSGSDILCRYPKSDPRYSVIMQKIEKDGLIAAGYAVGERKGSSDPSQVYTDTTVRLEKVFYGTEKKTEITVREQYTVYEYQGRLCFTEYSSPDEKLVNDRLVLLFLYKDDKGLYRQACEAFPLTEDYADYDEKEYIGSLCAFYRGDRSVYMNGGERWFVESTVKYYHDDGKVYEEPITYEYGGNVWPECNLSDAEVLAALNENVLVQTAVNHKVVLWPYGHKNYTAGGSLVDDHNRCSSYTPSRALLQLP
ncbi:MAG: hypothetical protein IJP27_04135 [Clostridia bacterium]|nr:hypothetical protein [Clostridia bacterium]